MTGVSPHLLGDGKIDGASTKTKFTAYMTIQQHNLMPSLMANKLIIRLVNGDIRHLGPSLCLAVTNFTVLHRYSQLLYIDIFH